MALNVKDVEILVERHAQDVPDARIVRHAIRHVLMVVKVAEISVTQPAQEDVWTHV